MQIVPFNPAQASQRFKIVLDGKLFILSFMWNTRFKFWSISFADLQGTICSGLKLSAWSRVLDCRSIYRMPQGYFMLVANDNSESAKRIERFNLGSTFSITYSGGV